MATWSSTIDRNTPRLSRRRVSLENKVSTAFEPGARFRGEVEDEARMPRQPSPHLGVLVGGVVVEDDMDDFAGRDLRLDGVEEADELLMAVALHAATDHLAFEHVESGKQRGRAMPLVIVRQGAGPALLHWQPRLGAVERLDLRFLVDREHDGVRRQRPR